MVPSHLPFIIAGSIVLIYNNAPGSLTPSFGDVNITGALIVQEDGERILSAFAVDPTVTVSFPSSYYNVPNPLTGGLVSVRYPFLFEQNTARHEHS
jgi:cellobiose-specific phosphotransferase system component IIC